MEEKKLTDEEIVKELERCAENISCEKECIYYNSDDRTIGFGYCIWKRLGEAVDLIRRLQGENAELKINNATIPEMWDKIEMLEADIHSMDREADGYRQTIDEQKAEIERLKNAVLDKVSRNEELIKDIERLTELQSRGAYRVAELGIENDELLKRVGELTKEPKVTVEDFERVKQQAVKDTAKEILQWLKTEVIMTEIPHGSEPCEEDVEAVMWWQIEEHFKKKYGVEVE